MAIARITAFHLELPLRWSIGHATASRRSSENVFAVVELTDGTVGFGEGIPRPYVTGETMESCWEALEAFEAESLAGAWPSLEAMDKALEVLSFGPQRAPSARCALELALLDALGRVSGLSAAALAAEALDLPKPAEREIAYSAVLPFARPGLLRLLSLGARAYGFPSVKLKVGHRVEDDSRVLEALRRWLGPTVELRADANGAWSPKEALDALDACRRAGLVCLEQPVAPDAWGELAGLWPKPSPVALMADESLCTEDDLGVLLATGVLGGASLRVAKMGGLLQAARIGRAACEAGVDILVGCHVGESSILSAAGRHLAALVPEARWYEGSFDRWILSENPVREPLGFGRGGRAEIRLAPGLGVEVQRELLQGRASRTLSIWPPERERS